jgi:hypothetical protein
VDLEDFYVVVIRQLLQHSRSDSHLLCNLGLLSSSAATSILRFHQTPNPKP